MHVLWVSWCKKIKCSFAFLIYSSTLYGGHLFLCDEGADADLLAQKCKF
jgi:hypothetical protein